MKDIVLCIYAGGALVSIAFGMAFCAMHDEETDFNFVGEAALLWPIFIMCLVFAFLIAKGETTVKRKKPKCYKAYGRNCCLGERTRIGTITVRCLRCKWLEQGLEDK